MKRLTLALWVGLAGVVAVLSGCVTGAHLVTGKPHSAVVIEAVRIYQEMPPHAELIGTVIAQSIGDDQASMDRGLKELKCQAAKVGANGLIINAPQQTPGRFLSSPAIQLSAQALFVP
jgi:hypothetical protein